MTMEAKASKHCKAKPPSLPKPSNPTFELHLLPSDVSYHLLPSVLATICFLGLTLLLPTICFPRFYLQGKLHFANATEGKVQFANAKKRGKTSIRKCNRGKSSIRKCTWTIASLVWFASWYYLSKSLFSLPFASLVCICLPSFPYHLLPSVLPSGKTSFRKCNRGKT